MSRHWFVALALVLSIGSAGRVPAATLHVPKDHPTIQAAVDAAKSGDTVLVEAGTYREQLRLRPGVSVRSAGDDAPGKIGLKRAEAAVIEGAGVDAKGPGVILADGAVLDGFTVTKVGRFDQQEYDKHHATQGEYLADERGAVGVGGEFPAVSVPAVTATVRHCIVRDNGHAGIGCTGAEGKPNTSAISKNIVFRNMGGGIGVADGAACVVAGNRCSNNLRGGIGNRNSAALIVDNECFDNVRAGIGIREGATPIVRGNQCWRNRRAGIGIRMPGTNPLVEKNECRENGMAGIGCRDGAAPIIRGNHCFKNQMAGIGARSQARPVIEGNDCHENEMAGIGCREGAAPVIRDNRCYRNQMAGIGCREGAKPIVEGNECFENRMAGIGARDGAAPIVRDNRCYKNEMAGIGARLGARPVIVDNDCRENQLAGIGVQEGAEAVIHRNRCSKNEEAGIGCREGARCLIVSNECRENKQAGIGARQQAQATIIHNQCLENGKVAIGVRQGSVAQVLGNELARTGGAPPLLAVGDGSSAVIAGNRLRGGGVCGVLVEGTARILGNQLEGNGDQSGSAIWALPKSDVTIASNRVDRFANLIRNSGCRISVCDNVVGEFKGTAISIQGALAPAHVYGNLALSKNPRDKVVVLEGAKGVEAENVLKEPGQADVPADLAKFWPAAAGRKVEWQAPEKSGRKTVRDGPWTLVATFAKTTTYQLYNTADDPQQKQDLAAGLEHMVFRLRGLLERQEAAESKAQLRKELPGK